MSSSLPMMTLRLDAEEALLAESVAGMLARACPPEARTALDGNGWSQDGWRALADAGVLEVTALPPDGLPSRSAAIVAMEVGRSGTPVPLAAVAGALTLLERCADPIASSWHDLVATGTSMLLPLWAGTVTSNGTVSDAGLYESVPYATAAAGFIVGAPDRLVLVNAARSVVIEHQPALGPMPVARVDLTLAEPGQVLRSPCAPSGAWRDARLAEAHVTAAVAVGAASAALREAVSYVSARKQFGVPIGSFQAVQHRLADAATEVELAMRLIVAAHDDAEAAARGIVRAERVAIAAYRGAAAAACQVMGGYGFTLEFDAQRHFRAAASLRLRGNTTAGIVDELADLQADAEVLAIQTKPTG